MDVDLTQLYQEGLVECKLLYQTPVRSGEFLQLLKLKARLNGRTAFVCWHHHPSGINTCYWYAERERAIQAIRQATWLDRSAWTHYLAVAAHVRPVTVDHLGESLPPFLVRWPRTGFR